MVDYRASGPVLSAAERSFYGVLRQALSDEATVLAKIRLADVITPKSGDRSTWQRAFNRISSKHLDFLVVDSDTFMPLVAIELDDRSHNSPKAAERDAVKADACRTAGLDLERISVAEGYVLVDVRNRFLKYISEESPRPATDQDTALSAPLCSRCGIEMQRRKTKRGKRAGEEFWGCTNYPKCRHTVSIDA